MDGFRPTNINALHASQLKDTELLKWLEKKLNEYDGWISRSFSSSISKEMIEELLTCFQGLDAPTKIKFLVSFLHVSQRHQNQWSEPMEDLLNFAQRDPDEWVEVIADIYREVTENKMQYPSSTNLNYKKTEDTITELLKLNEDMGNLRMDPRSLAYSTRSVRQVEIELGEPLTPNQHFVIKKAPKSEALKRETDKQADLAKSGRREKGNIVTSSIPIKMRSTRRDGNNDLPMKGIPSANTVKMSGGFTNEPKKYPRAAPKREGGAKLIDIGELPMSLKRRRLVEKEEEKKRQKEEKEQARIKAIEDKKAKEDARRDSLIKAKEEAKAAAAAIRRSSSVSSQPSTSPKKPAVIVSQISQVRSSTESEPTTPRVPITPTTPTVPKAAPKLHSPPAAKPMPQKQEQKPLQQPSAVQYAPSQQQQQRQQAANQPMHQQPMIQPQMQQHFVQATQPLMHMQQQNNMQQQYEPIMNQHHMQQGHMQQQIHQAQIPQQMMSRPNTNMQSMNYDPQMHPGMRPAFIMPPQSRERMASADLHKKIQDIIGTANALNDDGRQMIYQFMSGDFRQNPQYNQRVVTLKLAESVEDGVINGMMQKLRVEVFFQMDFGSGEWKRMRKCRALRPDELDQMQMQDNVHVAQWQQQMHL